MTNEKTETTEVSTQPTQEELLKAYDRIHGLTASWASEWRFGKDGELYCSESCEEE